MGEKYIIEAGPRTRPESVEIGVLEKGSGQTVITGQTAKRMHKRADIGIPNYTDAWGARTIDGKIPENRVEVTDPKYKGQIKFFKWGDPRGYLIPCRYLKEYSTLDVQYQDRLGAKDTIREDTDVFYLTMQSGDNIYDPETDPMLVQMLRIHYLNENSESRSPGSYDFKFRNVADLPKNEIADKVFSTKFEALKVVNDAAQDNSLQKLRNLSKIIGALLLEEVKENNLYSSLSILAESQPEAFLGQVKEWQKQTSNTFEKLKSYQAIDLEKDGTIAAGLSPKELIIDEVPGKGENMLLWLLANYCDERVFQATSKLKQIADKLK